MTVKTPPMFVLAGGLGTRLRSVVNDVPKPLAPIDGKPFLHLLIDNWINQGVREFVFLLHYKADQIISSLEKFELLCNNVDISFDFVVENELLGSGGALKNALNLHTVEGDFFVTNGDTWLANGVSQLMTKKSPCIVSVEVSNPSRYANIVCQNETVLSFSEACNLDRSKKIYGGSCLLHKGIFEQIKIKVFSIENLIFPKLVEAGHLSAVHLNCDFIDIGIPEDYHKFVELARCWRSNT